MRKQLARSRSDDRPLVVLSCEISHRVHVSELSDGDEFDFVVGGVAAQKICAGVSTYAMDSWKYLSAQEPLVLVGIFMGCPSVPDPADHKCLSDRCVRLSFR